MSNGPSMWDTILYVVLVCVFAGVCFMVKPARADTQPIVVVNPIEYDKMRMQCRVNYQGGVLGPNTYAVDICIDKVNELEKARTGTYPGEIKW